MDVISVFCFRIVLGYLFSSGLIYEVYAASHENHNSQWSWPLKHGPKIPIPENDDQGIPSLPSHAIRTKAFQDKGNGRTSDSVQVSIIPVVHQHMPHTVRLSEPSFLSEAKVHVLAPTSSSPRNGMAMDASDQSFVSASSTLMDFNEDTSKLFRRRGINRHRHSSKKRKQSFRRQSQFSEDSTDKRFYKDDSSTLKPKENTQSSRRPRRRRLKVRIPVKALFYEEELDSSRRRTIPPLKHPINKTSLITLHSPTRIYIPVWSHGDESKPFATDDPKSCVRCPANQLLVPNRGDDSVIMPVPAVSICPHLARQRGRMNIAVTVGPRPGTKLVEGEYPIELIAWKIGGHVSSCQYTVTVTVRYCQAMVLPEGTTVDCTNGTIWGSRCVFGCSGRNFILKGSSLVHCEGNENSVSWTSSIPTCEINYNLPEVLSSRRLPCKMPKVPTDGTVVCGRPSSNDEGYYPDGSVCQYFCFPNFRISSQISTDALVVCRNGEWTPESNITCSANFCSRPDDPQYGTVTCEDNSLSANDKDLASKSRLSNGTICQYRCNDGYITPTSSMPFVDRICIIPQWNNSAIPECKRAVPPVHHSADCRNRTFVVEEGEKMKLSNSLLPRFTSASGRPLSPTCSLGEKKNLKRGLNLNVCQVTDPELRVTTTCSYYIRIRERITPQPDPRDCRNRSIIATRRGTAVLKLPRFPSSESSRSVLRISCTHTGEVGIGSYINRCTAFDPELNVTGHCNYSVVVKERSCEGLPGISHGKIRCVTSQKMSSSSSLSYPPQTVCEYICHDGFVIPTRQRKWRTRKCLSKLKWSTSKLPSCKKAVPPQAHPKDCQNLTVFLKRGETFVKLTLPRFKSSHKGGKVKIRCSLNNALSFGNYTNVCEAKDVELGLTSSCTYNISVKSDSCSALPSIEFGDLECSISTNRHAQPVSSVCRYLCHPDYIIPTSQLSQVTKVCTEERIWNNTLTPTCLPKLLPQPTESSCLEQTIVIDDISQVLLPLPEFVAANGFMITVNCTPATLQQYGVHNVSCEAYDIQLRLSNFCQFTLNLFAPNSTAELDRKSQEPMLLNNGCIDQFVDAINASLSPITYPEFITIRNTSAEVTCTPLNFTESRIQEMHCEAVDPELGSSVSCSFNVTIATTTLESDGTIEVTTEMPHQSTTPEFQTQEPILLNNGCVDQFVDLINTSFPPITYPEFITTRNTSAEVTCTPLNFAETGIHEIRCEAVDPELGISASCSFNVTIVNTTLESNGTTEIATEIPHPNTTPKFQTEEPILLNNGCIDRYVDAMNTSFPPITYPEFITIRNTSAEVTCTPLNFTVSGIQEVHCEAVDPELGSSVSCRFNVTIAPTTLESDGIVEITTKMPHQSTTPEIQRKDCESLTAPANGHVTCRSGELMDICDVMCEEGFNFSSSYTLIQRGYVSCDQSDGLWDFQRIYNINVIPDCLGELPTTSVEVWLKFKAAVEDCDEQQLDRLQAEIKDRLLIMNSEPCTHIDCNVTFEFNCSLDEDRNRLALETRWTIQAAFDPMDYEYIDDVPEAEIQIESVLETTQKAVTTSEKFRETLLQFGAELWQKTYKQGHILLVCQKRGFIVDSKTNKCVECPSGTAEIKGSCEPCPENQYQEKTGQSICLPCSEEIRLSSGSSVHSNCRGV